MKLDFEEISNFDKWMLKIKNVYYSDNDRMVDAYEKILPLKVLDI